MFLQLYGAKADRLRYSLNYNKICTSAIKLCLDPLATLTTEYLLPSPFHFQGKVGEYAIMKFQTASQEF